MKKLLFLSLIFMISDVSSAFESRSLLGTWECRSYEIGEGEESFVLKQYANYYPDGVYEHQAVWSMKQVPEFWFEITSEGAWNLKNNKIITEIVNSDISEISNPEFFSEKSLFYLKEVFALPKGETTVDLINVSDENIDIRHLNSETIESCRKQR